MNLVEVITLTKIPSVQPQILTYFSGENLPLGALVLVPLGKRKETAVVLNSEPLEKNKMKIKKADFELRNVSKIICAEPVLTKKQIDLALWLGQYYFASAGIFLKMMMPKKIPNLKFQIPNKNREPETKSQKLIITPTIAWAQNLAKKEKNAILWHSELSQKQQNETWWKIRNNEVEKIIGTRSAVFLPFQNLKEIIIEDESNLSHKSWDMWPHYRSLETAQKLTEIFGAQFILKSDFLSIESFYFYKSGIKKSKNKNYQPETEIVDLRLEIKSGNFSIFSRRLQELIKETLERRKQTIIFSNRRGTANFILCRDCGFVVKCKNCDSPLAYHLINGQPNLLCHHCSFTQKPPEICPQCQSWRLKAVGTGTQKIEIEAGKFFPRTRIARLDSDLTPKLNQQKKIIESFSKKEIEILIVSPVFLSWFKELKKAAPDLSALISADTLLHLPDFRSGERTFQIIKTLENLAKKNLIIQTYNPENQVLNFAAKNQWPEFLKEELETRQTLNYPPFSQIVKLTFRHQNPQKAGQEAKILKVKLERANKDKDTEISEAAPAFISKEKGKYIWNIIIKFKIKSLKFTLSETSSLSRGEAEGSKANNEFLAARNSLLKFVPSNFEIDIDPVDLL